MHRARRPAAALVVAAALAGSLAGCSTAPPAAIVNGQEISEQQLSAQLGYWASSPAYVQTEDSDFLDQAESEQQQGQQPELYSVVGDGTGQGVYDMTWSDFELSSMISADAVSQYLQRRGEAPTAAQVDAAWASEYASNPTVWAQLAPAARSAAALADANHALVEGSAVDPSADVAFYRAHSSYFWSRVCLFSVDATVPGSDGGVDMSASKAQALKIASQLESKAPAVAPSGQRYCDTPEQFIELSPELVSRVGTLAPGNVAVVPESYGYQVLQVVSRSVIPYSSLIAGDIAIVAVLHGYQGIDVSATSQPTPDVKLQAVLDAAHVTVNSAYGYWATDLPLPQLPQVIPPGDSVSASPSPGG